MDCSDPSVDQPRMQLSQFDIPPNWNKLLCDHTMRPDERPQWQIFTLKNKKFDKSLIRATESFELANSTVLDTQEVIISRPTREYSPLTEISFRQVWIKFNSFIGIGNGICTTRKKYVRLLLWRHDLVPAPYIKVSNKRYLQASILLSQAAATVHISMSS